MNEIVRRFRFAKPWKDISLAAKFIALVVVFTAVILTVMTVITYRAQRAIYINNLTNKCADFVRFVGAISPDPIFSGDIIELNYFVKELTQAQDIVYVVITDAHGNNLTNYLDADNSYVQHAKQKLKNAEFKEQLAYLRTLPDIIVTKHKIDAEHKLIGMVEVGASKARVNAVLRNELTRRIVVGSFFIIFISTGIYLIFRRYALIPIRKLIHGSERISKGDLEQEIDTPSNDELGVLSHAFNNMMHALKKSQSQTGAALAELRDLNRNLEQRVEERTRALEKANKQLTQLALYDSLTLLPNRTLFNDRLCQTLNAAKLEKTHTAIMVLDLDHFKEVNDTLGHHMGDEMLKDVARRLSMLLRPSETIARFGGDEFAVLLPQTDGKAAADIANEMLSVFKKPFKLEGLQFGVMASIGCAVYPEHGEDMVSLLKCADIAMYAAKQNKSGYFEYQKDIDTHSTARLTFTSELKHSVESNQLELYYQPILNISDLSLMGVEALTRWHHPEFGFVPPDQFIPIIEQSRLVRNFTCWVINQALQQWDEWRKKGIDMQMSVNLSMRNLQDYEFPQQICQLMSKWNVPKGSLRLEVTESIIMSNPDFVLDLLLKLQILGAQIAIDDFGTGYSSLSLLKRLPVHEIKIDRSFVMDMAKDKDDLTIVRSIIDLAHNLDLALVAEGIESREIVQQLRTLGCDMGQGYYFSKPVPASVLEKWIEERAKKPINMPA